MSNTKDVILDKTHCGLNVYAFVVRQYYPDENVLSLSGRECKPARNPFNGGKPTLMVKIANGCAVHTDSENAIPNGNVFDFAEKHFRLKDQELLNKINDALHLSISTEKCVHESEPVQLLNTISNEATILSPIFSYFTKPVTNVYPKGTKSIYEVYSLIKGDEFSLQTTHLRSISDSASARKYKAENFDYVTFSGVFSRRHNAGMVKHSGLMAIDFDHIENPASLKERLLNDRYFDTELLFVSPSGDGLKWIIPTDLTQLSHQEYFKAVGNYIKHTYSLDIDPSGKDVSRACFLPHDPQVYINPRYL